MKASVCKAIEDAIRAAVGNHFRARAWAPLSGGCVDESWRVDGPTRSWFVKVAAAADAGASLVAEADGLLALDQAHGLRVPQPIAWGDAQGRAFLVLEYIDLQPLNPDATASLGEGIAELHGIVADTHGWDRDNRIGATPQRNARTGHWSMFWRENRLGYQLELAAGRGHQRLARAGERLMNRLPARLELHCPEASLLHGDLWSGNAGMDATGRPVTFDPASYHGDRETDLAMAELFGGFSPLFFEAYRSAWPVDAGYLEWRRDLYQLYHLLNHDAMFGGHYADESMRVIQRLLSRL